MTEDTKSLSWWAKLFRAKSKLTYWIDGNVFVVEVSKFTEKNENCIIFLDYFSQKAIMVKHDKPISYVLEEIK